MSTAFGVMPRPRTPPMPDRFGRAFPDFERLVALPDAMRHEAALLAREAGLDIPPGALAGRRPDPHAIIGEPFIGAEPTKSARQLLEEFLEARIAEEPGAFLPIENAQAAFYTFCHDQGETTPSDRALLNALIRQFGRPPNNRKGPITGFPDITLKGGRP
ncbi:MAG: hypothetical protein MEQ84_07760 [Mesorhizobium sp.]|nr:hypothetical protein [Mesorhizobium sp.]